MNAYGKLTVNGSEVFEKKLSYVLDQIAKDVKTYINSNLYESIILIGGYGRGEGGVVCIDGIEFPHNNFDFVVISKDINDEQTSFLDKMCKRIFDKHSKKLGIFVEFTILSSSKLKSMDPLLITYDMKYGHKVIVGQSSSLVNNKRFEVDTIPSWDIRNLIVNRGTLLIINDLILSKPTLSKKDRQTVVKHWIKAIIGYGDALLFYLDKYNYSYVEKQKRMKEVTCVSDTFKLLYDKAMNFRFSPNYKRYEKFNIKTYQNFVKEQLEDIHFRCEELALGDVKINSITYINKAVEEALSSNNSLKGRLKKAYYLLKKVPVIKKLSVIGNIRYRMLGMKGMMPILFPFIAYNIRDKEFDEVLKDFFRVSLIDENHLKNRYLTYWKEHVNSNFVREDFGL